MSYRRDRESAQRWQKWLLKNRDEVLASGVPPFVIENERFWSYFLDHGYFSKPGICEPLINVDRMEKIHAVRLCLFLEKDDYYPSSIALNRLQYILKRGRHADRHD